MRFLYSASTVLVAVLLTIWCCQLKAISTLQAPGYQYNFGNIKNFAAEDDLKYSGIDAKVLQLAYKAYKNARSAGYGAKELLTIVDYSMPSTAKRLWVIDMRTKRVLHHTHVAHGKGTGDNFAKHFSNEFGSQKSSLGMLVTGSTYNGRYGKSLELYGLEQKFNSNAHARRIVFHKAHYVDENIIKKIGRLGRSLGCLALNNRVAATIMNTIKDGSLVFCYYPDQKWLQESKLL